MREAKTASIAGRKRLNEQTKAFRQLTPAAQDQTTAFNELLKEYQKEIDQLSGRAKLGETAFLALYKAIYEAPDPTPAIHGLSGVLMESSSHQLEIERLKSELRQYEEEFRELKNQDITIRRLEDQIAGYQAGIEERVVEEVARRTAEIEEAAENRVAEARSAQFAAEKRMGSALEEVQASRRAADRCQAQVLELASEAEGRLGAASTEIRMLTEDADRLRSRIGDLERELDRMHALSSGALPGSRTSGGLPHVDGGAAEGSASMASEYRALQSVAEELRHEVQRREDDARADRARYEASLREVNLQLSVERETSKRVQAELLARPAAEYVASLRRQVKLLQQIAFHGQEEDVEEVCRRVFVFPPPKKCNVCLTNMYPRRIASTTLSRSPWRPCSWIA
jgi:homeobox protein cut-like